MLGGYVAVVAGVNLWWLGHGSGSVSLLIAQLAVIGAAFVSSRSTTRLWIFIGDWLPLIVLPLLYWELPWATIGPSGRLFDGMVQGWDLALFGTEPARTLAGALPSRPLSEVLHLAYLLYYAIIYLPPAILYGDRKSVV